MVRMIKNASEITDLNKSYIMEAPQDKVIKDIDEITDINKSIIFQPETKRTTQQKHKKKRTKKDVLNNANKRKEKQNGFLPPDVAAMQADVEFIKQQLQKEKQANKKNTRKNRLNISIPLSFYGQPMRPVKNDIAKTSKKAINNQKTKEKGNQK